MTVKCLNIFSEKHIFAEAQKHFYKKIELKFNCNLNQVIRTFILIDFVLLETITNEVEKFLLFHITQIS